MSARFSTDPIDSVTHLSFKASPVTEWTLCNKESRNMVTRDPKSHNPVCRMCIVVFRQIASIVADDEDSNQEIIIP